MFSPEIIRAPRRRRPTCHAQRGISLIETLVGLLIGLMVVAAAIGTLILSRGAAGSVSDLSQLQQQGSYALRVIGLQVRQAGSLDLVRTSGLDTFSFNAAFTGVDGNGTAVIGTEGANGAADSVSFSNQPSLSLLETQAKDCLGNAPELTGVRMDSTFLVDGGELRCKGAIASQPAQPLISNVADFQVWYRVKTSATSIRRLNATEVNAQALWPSVRSVEVCLDLQGNETGHPDAGATYTSCKGGQAARNGRLHLVFTNVFDLRTQGS